MNFWERKIHRALECNLTFLFPQSRGLARHKSIQFRQSQVPQWYIDASYTLGGKFHAILSAVKNYYSSWTRLANVNMWVKFLPRNSEVFKIFINYLSCLVYNQVYNLFVCTLCPCLTSFPQRNWDMQTTTKFPPARHVMCHVKPDCVT